MTKKNLSVSSHVVEVKLDILINPCVVTQKKLHCLPNELPGYPTYEFVGISPLQPTIIMRIRSICTYSYSGKVFLTECNNYIMYSDFRSPKLEVETCSTVPYIPRFREGQVH